MITQFNVRIAKGLKRRASLDKLNSGATLDIIAEVALEDFFTRHTPEQRKKFYAAHSRKPFQPCLAK